MVVAVRRHILLPLDDCLHALQPSIPHLTRSSLHRCLQRHGLSRVPDVDGDKPKRQTFKRCPIGFFHIDITEVRAEEGKLFPFAGIDRTSKFAAARLAENANRKTARDPPELLLEAVPCKIHTILPHALGTCPSDRPRRAIDNGIQFAEQPGDRNTVCSGPMRFDMICEGETWSAIGPETWSRGIEHRLTKPNHPCTNAQVGRMYRATKEAAVKRDHHKSHEPLRSPLAGFPNAFTFARRSKSLSGLTSYEYICKICMAGPDRFILNPSQKMARMKNWEAGKASSRTGIGNDTGTHYRVTVPSVQLRLSHLCRDSVEKSVDWLFWRCFTCCESVEVRR